MALGADQFALTKLYLASFARAPEAGGLAYWSAEMAGGKPIDEIVKTVFSLPIVKAIYPDVMSNGDFLTAVYRNCFGKVPDADGLAYWTGKLGGGAERSALVMTMIDAGLGAPDGTLGKAYIANRLDSAQYAVTQQLAQGKQIPVQKLIDIMLAVNAETTTLTPARATIDQYSGAKIVGRLADGYIKGATVFADADGDGEWNPGEAMATTDGNGNFTLTGAKGALVGSGGIDLSTNQAFKGVLKAPESSTVVNPLTSLQQGFVETGLTLEQAESSVAKALGFDASKIDLQNFDPLAAALSPGSDAEAKNLGARLQAEAAKIADLLATASSALAGAANDASHFSQTDAAKAIIQSIVSNIAKDSDGAVDLADTSLLRNVLTESVALAGDATLTAASAKVAALADSFATLAADSLQKVNEIAAVGGDITAMLARIAQSQAVTQGDMAEQILIAARTGSTLSALETSFTGTALDSAVAKAAIGDLDPTSTADNAVTATINTAAAAAAATAPPNAGSDHGGAGSGSGAEAGGGSSGSGSGSSDGTSGDGVTPAPVVASLDGLHGSFASPAVFDAAAGAGLFNFTDSVATASFTRITHFGSDDSITISGGGSNHLIVANNGADVVLTVNDNGTVSQITLVGVASAAAIIGSLNAFNALSVGDVTYS